VRLIFRLPRLKILTQSLKPISDDLPPQDGFQFFSERRFIFQKFFDLVSSN
jgi:hypothetical protein